MVISGYELDNEQLKIVHDESKNLLVVAGAGSGKTLTILGKINYLINYQNISPKEIICISFTKAASDSLREKIKSELNLDMDVYTFHKLALTILDNKYQIADPYTLEYIIDDLFNKKLFYKYTKKMNEKEIKQLKRLLLTFTHLFKCNNYKLQDFNNFLKQIKTIFNFNYKKEKNFLIMALNIYLEYEKYLKNNNEIDFDDMIIRATSKVNNYFFKKIKYIIIDEYQDTSLVRFNLIRSIIDKTNSKLMVVGDDFQSIYRFTGSSINMITCFKKYFGYTKIIKINNTYRNSLELNIVANKFILKNNNQVSKKIYSSKRIDKPIKIIYYNKNSSIKLKRLLNILDRKVLILCRNIYDVKRLEDDEIKVMEDKILYNEREYDYKTIHKSKGLEEENVIVLNLEDSIYGFPNKKKDITELILEKEKYKYEEERRLFYVALTRTKNNVYLFSSSNNPSIFIKEIIKYRKYIEVLDL